MGADLSPQLDTRLRSMMPAFNTPMGAWLRITRIRDDVKRLGYSLSDSAGIIRDDELIHLVKAHNLLVNAVVTLMRRLEPKGGDK